MLMLMLVLVFVFMLVLALSLAVVHVHAINMSSSVLLLPLTRKKTTGSGETSSDGHYSGKGGVIMGGIFFAPGDQTNLATTSSGTLFRSLFHAPSIVASCALQRSFPPPPPPSPIPLLILPPPSLLTLTFPPTPHPPPPASLPAVGPCHT